MVYLRNKLKYCLYMYIELPYNLRRMVVYTTSKFNHLLTGKSRTIYRKSMHGAVSVIRSAYKYSKIIAKVLCEFYTGECERQQEALPVGHNGTRKVLQKI